MAGTSVGRRTRTVLITPHEYQPRRNQMKKSLIWTTAGIAVIGISGPVFAAHRADDRPVVSTPATTVVASTTPTSNSAASVTVNSVEDRTANSVADDSVTASSVD